MNQANGFNINLFALSGALIATVGMIYIWTNTNDTMMFLTQTAILLASLGFTYLAIGVFLAHECETSKESESLSLSLRFVLTKFYGYDLHTKVKLVKPLMHKLVLLDDIEQESVISSIQNISMVGFIMDLAKIEGEVIQSQMSEITVHTKQHQILQELFGDYAELQNLCAEAIKKIDDRVRNGD